MKFSVHKLAKEKAASSMRRVPLRLFRPFTLMIAPIYTLLERNEKFVAVKAPLSFFSPAELEKYRGVTEFYLPNFIDRIEPFQKVGDQITRVLSLSEAQTLKTNQGEKEAAMPISPFEVSDAILRALGPLWGTQHKIEPFFLIFFGETLCDPLSEAKMQAAVDVSVSRFELGILRANLAIFIAVHLGVYHRSQLTSLRDRVFDETVSGSESQSRQSQGDLIVALSHRLLPTPDVREIKITDFNGSDLVSSKMRVRLKRVAQKLIPFGTRSSTLFGEGGICGGD